MLADAAREALLKVEDLRDRRDDIERRHAEERAKLLKPIKKDWNRLESVQQAELSALDVTLKAAEAQAKQCTIELGETVKGESLMCCFAAGRVTWNSDMLDGMTPAYPAIANAKTIGDPSASIRKR